MSNLLVMKDLPGVHQLVHRLDGGLRIRRAFITVGLYTKHAKTVHRYELVNSENVVLRTYRTLAFARQDNGVDVSRKAA